MKEKNKIKIYRNLDSNTESAKKRNIPLGKTKDKLDPPPQVFSYTLSKQPKKKRRSDNKME